MPDRRERDVNDLPKVGNRFGSRAMRAFVAAVVLLLLLFVLSILPIAPDASDPVESSSIAAADLVFRTPGIPVERVPPGRPEAATPSPGEALLPRLDVRVEARDGDPLPGAGVAVRDEGSWDVRGTTGPDGRLSGLERPRVGAVVAAFAAGSATRELVVTEHTGAELVLRLPAATPLAGQVRWSDGAPAGYPEVEEVWAIPVHLEASRDVPALDLRLHPGVCRAEVDADGHFVLSEADADTAFVLRARGAGLFTLTRATVWQRDRPATVMVARLFGVALSVEDSLGGPVRCSPHAFGPGIFQRRTRGREGVIEPVEPDRVDLLLAGLDPDSVRTQGWNPHHRWHAGTRDFSWIGPFESSLHLAGYRPASAWHNEQWVALGLERVVLRPEALASGWGWIELELSGHPPAAGTTRVPFAILKAASTGRATGPRDDFSIRVPWPDEAGAVRLGPVPDGDYELTLALEPSKIRVAAAAPVRIENGQVSRLALDLRAYRLGSLRVEANDAFGRAHEGVLAVRLQRLEDEIQVLERFTSFEQAPYVVGGLPAGTWRVLAERIAPLHAGLDWSGQVELEEGRVGVVTLSR